MPVTLTEFPREVIRHAMQLFLMALAALLALALAVPLHAAVAVRPWGATSVNSRICWPSGPAKPRGCGGC